MADVSREKILKINTTGAEKNVKSLKTQIRELKEQLAGLEKGTVEYDAVSKKLADTNQKQIEINEAMMYSNKDFGATLSNLTKVTAGVVGAISSVNSVMVMMGADSEEAMEAMKRIQALMAIIQGLGAIDTAVKALKGLTVAFQGFNDVRVKSITTSVGASGAELAEAGALSENTKEMKLNNEMAELYNEAQRSNTTETNKSTEALLENNLAQLKNQEAMIDRIVANRKTSAEMEVLNNQLKEGTITAEEYQKATGVSAEVVARYKARIDETVAALGRLRGVQTTNMELAKELQPVYNAQTGVIEQNSLIKTANEKATEDVADAEKKLGDGIQKREPILRKIGSGFKTFFTKTVPNGFKSLLNFVKLNPIFLGLSATVAAIGYGISKWISAYNDARKEAYEFQKMQNEIDMEFRKQMVDMRTLLTMFEAQNTTQEQKEVLAKKINKLANDELVVRNKITGEWELSIEKVKEYMANLRTSIELEYHKKAILEAMDKEEEARQDANYERHHFIGNLFRSEEGYLEDAAEAVAEQAKHWKAIEKLTAGTVKNIENENKELEKNTTGGGIKKTFADLLKELKALWKDFYAQLTKEKELKRTFNGIYSEALIAYDKAMEAINGSMLGKKISKDFVKAFEGGLKDIKSNEITLDMIFVDVKDLDKQLDDAKNVLRKLFNEGKKVTDKQVQDAKKRIDQIKDEIAGYEAIAKSVYDYKKALEDLEKTRKETNDANALYNKQQDININYKPKVRREQGRDFQYEETNKEIEQQRLLYQTTMKRLTEEKARLDELKQSNLENKATIEEIAELEKKIAEDQKAANEAQMQMDELRYQNRMTELNEEYAAIENNSEIAQQWYEIEQSIKGGGVADYNIDVDLLEMQLEAIVEKADMVDEYYKKLQEQHDENSQEWYVLEQERLAAQEALQRQYMDKEIEMEQEKSKRKLNIQKAYIAAYQNISSQVSNILGTLMNEYDENSKEYLNLKYAQGVTDTLSGTLAAYMSGIESGLPAPANTILAIAMALSTFSVGVAQLANIKNNSLSNAATPNTVEIGNEYDTLSYAQNAEILSNIQDSRVYVVESDISDTQRRVHVAESAAMF